MATNIRDNAGCQWVGGTAGVDSYPTDGIGTRTATAASSALHLSKVVQLLGIYVTAAAAGTIELVDGAGTPIATLAFSSATLGWAWKPPSDGARYVNLTDANVGIRCPAAVTATLFFRKLL